MPLLLVALGLLIALALAGARLSRQVIRLPANHPEAFLKRGRQPASQTLVVCAGDSLTHAVNSGDYLKNVRRRLDDQGYEFINAGINGDLAYNLLQRMDDVITCQPDRVTVLIGTNDVLGTLSEQWASYYMKAKHSPQPPSFEWFCHNLAQILQRLQTETSAEIALVSLPPISEELESETNQLVRRYNTAIQEMAASSGSAYLPLYETLSTALSGAAAGSPKRYSGDFRQTTTGILLAMVRHYLLRQSWDEIGRRNGLELLFDHIHLTDRAAALTAELIADWLVNCESGPENAPGNRVPRG